MGQEEDAQMALAGDDVVDDLRRPPIAQGEYAGQDLGQVLSFFCLEMVVHGRCMGEDVTGIVQEFKP